MIGRTTGKIGTRSSTRSSDGAAPRPAGVTRALVSKRTPRASSQPEMVAVDGCCSPRRGLCESQAC